MNADKTGWIGSFSINFSRWNTWAAGAALLSISLIFSWLDRSGSFLHSLVAYSLLFGLSAAIVLWAGKSLECSRRAWKAALAAAGIRLFVGLALFVLLPIAGYQENQASQAGYVFQDAFVRDGQAWDLASSPEPLISAFSGGFSGDQYGGLLALSAALYRLLSLDAHRPLLILILVSALGSLGVIFLWQAAREWFGEEVAITAAWILALYPEGVLLGSSQMREAMIIPAIAITFYGLTQRRLKSRLWLAWIGLGGVILLIVHPPSALISLLLLLGLSFFDPEIRPTWTQAAIFLGALVACLGLVLINWSKLPSLQGSTIPGILSDWLQHNFYIQSFQLERASGWMQKLLRSAGEGWWPLIVIAYGLSQPVLPAAIFDPAAWIWVAINVWRAAGWYLLAPMLVYSLFASFRAKTENRRLQLIWLSLTMGIWTILVAANAGGDLWDNPRYRAVFLVFQALLAAWAWRWARRQQDAWLMRIFIIEGIFLLFFSQWYASRKYEILGRLDFWLMVFTIGALGMVVILVGWLRDLRQSRRIKQKKHL